jgi:hypothetical protein
VRIEPGVNELGTLMTARLPGVDESPRFERGKTIASGAVTLTLAADAVVEPNTLDYETEQLQQTFRAVQLPEPAVNQLEPGFVAVFGLAPLDTSICPSPALSLPNTGELPPGTELELYGLGLSALEEWVPYGTWKKLGEGAVSEDGQSLDFPDGIAALTTIGVKVKQ